MKQRLLTSMLILVLLAAVGPIQPVQAATITVDTTNDVLDAAGSCFDVTVESLPGADGVTSLREAICAANKNDGPDMIQFNITGCGGVCSIQPTSALPILSSSGTTINGYSQNGAMPATTSAPAALKIELDGSSVTNCNGLNINSADNHIRGLVINRFDWNGIAILNSGATGNVIEGNYLGTDASGNTDQGNNAAGVYIAGGAQNNIVGGDEPSERNLISGNSTNGAAVSGEGTSGNTISGNIIGLGANGVLELGNDGSGAAITDGASNNTIGGDTSGEMNIISENHQHGVLVSGAGTMGNTISGNYIGLDASGTMDRGNNTHGILIQDGTQNNVIGGDTGGKRNIISANGSAGVKIHASTANTISGNYIGTNANGTTGLGNTKEGVNISDSEDNLIGGDTPGKRNVISGNQTIGVYIITNSSNNTIAGNYIGVNASGTSALGNAESGLHIGLDAHNNIIGGDAIGKGNVISGNGIEGIWVSGWSSGDLTRDNTIIGNYIGTDATGMLAIPNTGSGIALTESVQGNIIGGNTEAERNIISGNQLSGVRLEGSNHNTISGNYIGVGASGNSALGNSGNAGIQVSGTDNTIGPNNTIAHNSGDGVEVNAATTIRNKITQNSIYANGGLGINLRGNSNGDIAAPTIDSATPGSVNIAGTACAGCTVEVFASHDADGEGETYLGSAAASPGGDFTVSVETLPYPYLTATATNATKGTSEFSTVFTTTLPILASSTKTADKNSVAPEDDLTYTITLNNTGMVSATAMLTDVLPAEVTWANQFNASSGTVSWDAGNKRLLWDGTVDVGVPVTITYKVTVNAVISSNTIVNTAHVNNGAGITEEIGPATVSVTGLGSKLYLPIVMKQ